MIGTIYQIIPVFENYQEGDVYYGATTRTMEKRFSEHCYKYNEYLKGKGCYVSSFTLFDKYGCHNCMVREMEKVEYENKRQLHEYENAYMVNNPCVNKRNAVLDMVARKQDKKRRNKIWFKIKHQCDCGGKYLNRHKAKHMKTMKHQRYLEQQGNNILG